MKLVETLKTNTTYSNLILIIATDHSLLFDSPFPTLRVSDEMSFICTVL